MVWDWVILRKRKYDKIGKQSKQDKGKEKARNFEAFRVVIHSLDRICFIPRQTSASLNEIGSAQSPVDTS